MSPRARRFVLPLRVFSAVRKLITFFPDYRGSLSPGHAFQIMVEREAALPGDDSGPLLLSGEGRPPIRLVTSLIEGIYDAALFSLENSPFCDAIERIAELFPGFLLLHDATFDSLFLARHRTSTSSSVLRQELEERFGGDCGTLADSFVRGWGSEGLRQLGRWSSPAEGETMSRIVTSSSLLRYFPEARYCPLPIFPEAVPAPSSEMRQELGIGDTEFLLVYAPENDLPDRTALLQEVCDELAQAGQPLRLLRLAAVEMQESEAIPLRSFEVRRRVSSVSALNRYLAAADAFAGLRVQEFSGVPLGPLYALGAGVPAIISLTAGGKEIPNSAGLHVRPGITEGRELFEVISCLRRDSALRKTLGEGGLRFVRSQHAPGRVLSEFRRVLEPDLALLSDAGDRRRDAYRRARGLLVQARVQSLTRSAEQLTNTASDALLRAADDFHW